MKTYKLIPKNNMYEEAIEVNKGNYNFRRYGNIDNSVIPQTGQYRKVFPAYERQKSLNQRNQDLVRKFFEKRQGIQTPFTDQIKAATIEAMKTGDFSKLDLLCRQEQEYLNQIRRNKKAQAAKNTSNELKLDGYGNFSESDLNLDTDDKFKGPKDAIKWCNEKFSELKDIKYKQIANYLHIYL